MADFSSITELFSDMGISVSLVVNNPSILYSVYFIAFLAIVYKLIEVGINRGKFKGKPARVISIMASLIITGGIFYNKSSTELLDLFENVAGFVIILALSTTILIYSIILRRDYKQSHPAWAFFAISFGLYLFSALMLPQMEFIVEKIESLLILVAVLEITYFIALAALLLALGRLFLSIFSSPASRASQRATREFSETAILKKYLKNLKAQFKQADEVVKNLERLI